jgi:hypothetical protein
VSDVTPAAGSPLTSDLREQIKQLFDQEQRENRIARGENDIPISFEAIAPEWFDHVVCRDVRGAHVTAIRPDEPDDGTSNRRRIFLTYNERGEAADLPSAVFCKANHSLVNRQITASLGFTQGEDTFYNRYRDRLDIEAPRALLAAYDPRSWKSIIVMHDLELDDAVFCTLETEVTRARAESQMQLLARLHGQGFGDQRAGVADLPLFESFFHGMDETFGFETICDEGLSAAEEVVPPALFARRAEIWPATLRSIAVHAAHPRTYTHVDCHLRNWYVARGDKMGICDFQTFSRGHWAFDVAYAMTTSLEVEDRRSWGDDLLRCYLETLHAHGGPQIPHSEARKYVRQHLFVALSWWTSTLAVAITQPRQASLALIERITAAIDDFDALAG